MTAEMHNARPQYFSIVCTAKHNSNKHIIMLIITLELSDPTASM